MQKELEDFREFLKDVKPSDFVKYDLDREHRNETLKTDESIKDLEDPESENEIEDDEGALKVSFSAEKFPKRENAVHWLILL